MVKKTLSQIMLFRSMMASVLYTDELSSLKLGAGYKGAFALDRVPLIYEETPYSFIFNSDPSIFPGEHWLAICIPPAAKPSSIFIDPLALPLKMYSSSIKQYLCNIGTCPIISMPFPIQDPFKSSACGQFCAYILDHLDKYNYNLYHLVNSVFSETDFLYNDSIVRSWFRRRRCIK